MKIISQSIPHTYRNKRLKVRAYSLNTPSFTGGTHSHGNISILDIINSEDIDWVKTLKELIVLDGENIKIDTNLYTTGGITMFGNDGEVDIPTIYDGLPIDGITIFWEDGILKAAGGGEVVEITSEMITAALGYTPLQNIPSEYVTEAELANKQDIISDLATIREGAAKGATALQSHQDISGKQDKLVSGTSIKTINGESILGSGDITIGGGGEGGSSASIQSITYSDIKRLKDNSQLTQGQQYRITDYVTTTKQSGTQSAGHPFDLIVIADGINKLNEKARAIQHDGDTYFANCNLSAWEIWYNIDNNTSKYQWADSTNGKGVIYRMIDEHGNECPYDFKNIQFIRYELNAPEDPGYGDWSGKLVMNIQSEFSKGQLAYIWSGTDEYDRYWEEYYYEICSSTTGNTKAFFTFSNVINGIIKDKSITEYCFQNKIDSSRDGTTTYVYLTNNVFFSTSETAVISDNILGIGCELNSFGDYSKGNTLGIRCRYNVLVESCTCNSLNSYCSNILLGTDCYYNNFGCYSEYICFGDSSKFNIVNNGCSYIILGMNSQSNIFGSSCLLIVFGNNSSGNSMGNNCEWIDAGNYSYITNNSFGNGCNYIDIRCNYCTKNSFGEGCLSITFSNSSTASMGSQVQNYRFAQGLEYATVTALRGLEYEMKVAKTTTGTIRIYCEAG